MKAGLAERFRALVSVFQQSGEITKELTEARCYRGADIARKMRFSEAVALGIQNLDEHWDGNGQPLGACAEEIPIYAQIALMAQVADVFQIANGIDAAKREIQLRAGSWFDPRLVAAFASVAGQPEFWNTLNRSASNRPSLR